MYACTRFTSPAFKNDHASVPPLSTITLSTFSSPSRCIIACKSSSPSFAGTLKTRQPASSYASFLPASDTAVTIQVGVSRAVCTTVDESGVRSFVSAITRIGFFPPGIRQVSCGLSASTVETPVRIAI